MGVSKPDSLRTSALHVCAWLLACATFPLIWVGGLVTTTDAGMAFRDWLTSDGYFMLFYPWLSAVGDKFVEHGHRLLGVLVGLLSIVLVIVAFRSQASGALRKFSLVILAGVILQGVLGGMRVVLDQRTLALIHGCTGPLVFALCAAMVVVSSSRFRQLRNRRTEETTSHGSGRVFRLALFCSGLAYLQLVLGALVRHTPFMTGPHAAAWFQASVYLHVLVALLLTIQVLLVVYCCFRAGIARRVASCMGVLILAQLALGVGTWLIKYGMPRWASSLLGDLNLLNVEAEMGRAVLITSHVAVGSLIIVCAVAIVLIAGQASGTGLRPWPRWKSAGASPLGTGPMEVAR